MIKCIIYIYIYNITQSIYIYITYVCMCVCINACMHVCICKYVCMYVYVVLFCCFLLETSSQIQCSSSGYKNRKENGTMTMTVWLNEYRWSIYR